MNVSAPIVRGEVIKRMRVRSVAFFGTARAAYEDSRPLAIDDIQPVPWAARGARRFVEVTVVSLVNRTMQRRQFGTTGIEVSELGLGCARVGGIFQKGSGGFDELLSRAFDLGINFYDTADMYCQGESEQLIGRAFRKRRSQVVIASKVGYVLPGQRKLVARIKPLVRPLIRLLGLKRARLPAAVSGQLSQNFEPAYVKRAVEASLRRLRTDYLDLLQLHSPPAEVVRRGQWLRALQDLQRSGKIRFYGISCDTLDAAQAALEVPGVVSLQVVVSLLEQRMAEALAGPARERGIAIIARECLANGLLAKPEAEIDYKSYCDSPAQEAERRAALVEYRKTATQTGKSLSSLALQFAAGVDSVAVALVGASRTQQLETTVRAYLSGS